MRLLGNLGSRLRRARDRWSGYADLGKPKAPIRKAIRDLVGHDHDVGMTVDRRGFPNERRGLGTAHMEASGVSAGQDQQHSIAEWRMFARCIVMSVIT